MVFFAGQHAVTTIDNARAVSDVIAGLHNDLVKKNIIEKRSLWYLTKPSDHALLKFYNKSFCQTSNFSKHAGSDADREIHIFPSVDRDALSNTCDDYVSVLEALKDANLLVRLENKNFRYYPISKTYSVSDIEAEVDAELLSYRLHLLMSEHTSDSKLTSYTPFSSAFEPKKGTAVEMMIEVFHDWYLHPNDKQEETPHTSFSETPSEEGELNMAFGTCSENHELQKRLFLEAIEAEGLWPIDLKSEYTVRKDGPITLRLKTLGQEELNNLLDSD